LGREVRAVTTSWRSGFAGQLVRQAKEREDLRHHVCGHLYEGQARFRYELDEDGKIKTNADGTVSVTWWLRDENGVWELWMSNTFARTTD
jgi:hypothetical protein